MMVLRHYDIGQFLRPGRYFELAVLTGAAEVVAADAYSVWVSEREDRLSAPAEPARLRFYAARAGDELPRGQWKCLGVFFKETSIALFHQIVETSPGAVETIAPAAPEKPQSQPVEGGYHVTADVLLRDAAAALNALMHEYVPADDSESDPQTRRVIRECEGVLLAVKLFAGYDRAVESRTAGEIDRLTAKLRGPLVKFEKT